MTKIYISDEFTVVDTTQKPPMEQNLKFTESLLKMDRAKSNAHMLSNQTTAEKNEGTHQDSMEISIFYYIQMKAKNVFDSCRYTRRNQKRKFLTL